MVEKHGMMANDEMGEGDFGWTWLIRAWTVLYHNVCYIEGMIEDEMSIEGKIEDSVDIEGKIGCWS